MISDERLVQIRARVEAQRRARGGPAAKDSRDELVEDLLAEVEDRRRERDNAERVQHIDPAALAELRSALEREGSGLSLHAIDVVDFVSHLQAARRDLRRALRQANERADGTLAKDFLALYQAACLVTSAPHETGGVTEGLALHVVRLAPLYDDVRMQLNLQATQREWDLRATIEREPMQPETVADAARRHGLGLGHDGDVYTLPSLLPDGVLQATPDELADVIARQLDEHQGAGIIDLSSEVPVMPQGNDIVMSGGPFILDPPGHVLPIDIGPTLLPRIEALAACGRLGRDLAHVVQTLFVLGILTAEGQDPQAHVGDPMLHVSAEALFVRFGIPHEGGAEAARRRTDILRQLFVDLSEWCDPDDPLRATFAAAVEALPR